MSDPNAPSGGYESGGYGSGGYDEGGYGGPPPPPGPPPSAGHAPEPKNFFAALFDFSFSTFVTPMIVKIVYILITIAIAIGLVIWVVAAFFSSVGYGIAALLLGWIPALLYLAFFRMTLEFYYSVVRMSQDINHRLPGA